MTNPRLEEIRQLHNNAFHLDFGHVDYLLRRIDAETKRREAAEAVLDWLNREEAQNHEWSRIQPLGDLVVAWQQAKAKYEKVVQ